MKKYSRLSLSRYLAELSSNKPVPGGGSVSAYAACLGMGLAEMVAAIGMNKAAAESKPILEKAIQILKKTRKDALQIVDLDPSVYQTVIKTYKKAKTVADPEKKNRLIDQTLENSFRLQADLALLVVVAREALRSLGGVVKGSIQNDLKVSAGLLEAAFWGAYHTAKINVVYLNDIDKKARAEQALQELEKRFRPQPDGKK